MQAMAIVWAIKCDCLRTVVRRPGGDAEKLPYVLRAASFAPPSLPAYHIYDEKEGVKWLETPRNGAGFYLYCRVARFAFWLLFIATAAEFPLHPTRIKLIVGRLNHSLSNVSSFAIQAGGMRKCMSDNFLGIIRIVPANDSKYLPDCMAAPILLAEDSDDDAFFFVRTLRSTGLQQQVIRVKNGREAIEYLQKTDAGRVLMFLDLKMPEVDGFEVLEWLQSHELKVTIDLAVLSGSSDSRDMNEAFSHRVRRYLVKPVSVSDLYSIIRSFQQESPCAFI
jgi:CheY-like chemotaxis protein